MKKKCIEPKVPSPRPRPKLPKKMIAKNAPKRAKIG
jgi:hypothetical protein